MNRKNDKGAIVAILRWSGTSCTSAAMVTSVQRPKDEQAVFENICDQCFSEYGSLGPVWNMCSSFWTAQGCVLGVHWAPERGARGKSRR